MSTGLWATIAAIGGLILTFTLGRITGTRKASEKRADALEGDVKKAEAEARSAEAKAFSAQKVSELAAGVIRILDNSNGTKEVDNLQKELDDSSKAKNENLATLMDIARRQADRAHDYMEANK